MSTEKSVREIVEEWNVKAKARGELLEQDPWSLPVLYHGSILDIPITTAAEERIRRLDALIGRLEPENAAAATTEQEGSMASTGSNGSRHATGPLVDTSVAIEIDDAAIDAVSDELMASLGAAAPKVEEEPAVVENNEPDGTTQPPPARETPPAPAKNKGRKHT